jgi:hypothetical protein
MLQCRTCFYLNFIWKVLGAAMFMVEIDGVRVLYTGDYSTENERL